jgi:hypothetical protein
MCRNVVATTYARMKNVRHAESDVPLQSQTFGSLELHTGEGHDLRYKNISMRTFVKTAGVTYWEKFNFGHMDCSLGGETNPLSHTA